MTTVKSLFLSLIGLLLTACPDDSGSSDAKTCTYEKQIYNEGESFPDADGCNTCTCENGEVACTEMACITGCEHNGKQYEPGDSVPAGDCNACMCQEDGSIACTTMGCDSKCVYNGVDYSPGDTFKDEDGCNTCVCNEDGTVECDTQECEEGCEYNGQRYDLGETFKDGDGCNTCTCSEDGILCTDMACVDTCEYNGKVYIVGETFDKNDECTGCTCTEEGIVCDADTCNDECEYNGEVYQVGESFKADDGCNSCTCNKNGLVACTMIACVNICEYNGQVYTPGDTFDADDGCNTCTCTESLDISCTEMACPPEECAPGLTYFEPGCDGTSKMPVIESGCYAECANTPCETGICQLTTINPCICEEGEVCCDACGSHEWLCLPDPTECPAPPEYTPIITAAANTFGMCTGDCRFTISLDHTASSCMSVVLNVCDNGQDGACSKKNLGTLTPVGHAKATGLAAEIMGETIEDSYGCPDCADGGASHVTLRIDQEETSTIYEYGNPPQILEQVDLFTQSLIRGLSECTANENLVIEADCVPSEK